MGWLSSTVHSITNVVHDAAKPVGNLFNSNTALARALVNPGDVVAVAQVFDNTAIKGQTPQKQASDTKDAGASVAHFYGETHQMLWNDIRGGVSWAYHGVIHIWHSVWYNVRNLWRQSGGRNHGDKLGDNIKTIVQKWGGERRFVAWTLVVVIIVVVIIIEWASWGSATPVIGPGAWALIMALLSFGVQQGLTPDQANAEYLRASSLSLVNNNDYNSNSNNSSNSGQSGSFLDDLANALSGLGPVALIGAAAVGTLGLFYLLSRR